MSLAEILLLNLRMSLIDRVKEVSGLSEKDVQDRSRLRNTVDYLSSKEIEPLLQSLLAELLEELPADPRAFLLARLKARTANSHSIFCVQSFICVFVRFCGYWTYLMWKCIV